MGAAGMQASRPKTVLAPGYGDTARWWQDTGGDRQRYSRGTIISAVPARVGCGGGARLSRLS
eukprot:scaffold54951_cov41-Prasinocladus_malaysianus.AAC.1